MGIQRVGVIERGLRHLFVPVFVAAGIVVAAGFFFPAVIGESISGRWWLVISLLFFGAGLGYLAVLPTRMDETSDGGEAAYLLRVRRLGLVGNFRRFLSSHDRVTFWVPVGALLVFFVLQWTMEAQFLAAIEGIRRILTLELGWVFAGVMLLSLLFCIYLMLSGWGEIRLGGPDSEPSYTYPVYFSMIFTAGIAAGIVFSGLSEPITHYGTPPPLLGADAGTDAAVEASLTYALFHWGFTAWSAYVVIGLPIAYYVYEKGAPLRVSAVLTPFLGADNLGSPLGKTVDILAIFATIGGIATSVALLSQQFLAGIDYQWDVTFDLLGPMLFVGGLSAIFILSAQSGVHRGIRRIAGLNIVLFVIFGLIVLVIGPRDAILSIGTTGVSGYTTNFVPMSLYTGSEWVAAWTIWNWAWWFSWAPFAGLFLAALSRGRRIKTVVFTGVVATGLATMAWFIILGSTALHIEHVRDGGLLEAIDEGGTAVAGFPLLDALAFSDLLMFMFLALIIVFMTTSADTSTLVIAILASRESSAPTTASIVFWGGLQGLVALAVLVTDTEGLLQGVAVLVGGPFAIIAVVAMIGLVLGLRKHDGDRDSILVRLWRKIPETPAPGQ